MWIFGRRAHQEREQNTDAMQSLTPYPLHQREQPILSDHDLFERYRRAHPPRPQIHPVTPIPSTPNTGAIPQLALPAQKQPSAGREWADVSTVKKLEKPAWMDNLPIQRQPPATVVSEFDPLATLLPERFRSPEVPPMPDLEMPDPDPLGFAGLPTWIAPETIDKRIEDIISRSGKLQDDSWLTAEPPVRAPVPEQALTLIPLTADELSIVDRRSISRLFEETSDALSELAALASQAPKDDTLEVPTVVKQKHEKKESE